MPNSKEIIFATATLIASVVSFWLWSRAIPRIVGGEFADVGVAVLPLILLGVSAALFSLAMIFIRSSRLAYGAVLAGAVIPYFFISSALAVIISMGVAILLVFSAGYRIRTEYMLSLGFHLTKILKSGLPIYLTAISLVISTLFFASLDEDRALSVLLPRSAFQTALPAILNYIIQPTEGSKKIGQDATVRETLAVVIRDQLQAQGIPSARISQKELEAAIALQITELENRYGLKLTGKERISDVFYGLVNNQILTIVGPYRKYLPHVSALTFFFAFKVITLPLYYVVMAVLMVLIKILVGLKILKSEIVEMKVERLTL